MVANDFIQGLLQEEETLGKLTGQLLDGNSDAFIDTATGLLSTVATGSALVGVLAKQAVHLSISKSSWRKLNKEINALKNEEKAALAMESQAARLAELLAVHFNQALQMSVENVESISTIIETESAGMTNRLDECFTNLFEANSRRLEKLTRWMDNGHAKIFDELRAVHFKIDQMTNGKPVEPEALDVQSPLNIKQIASLLEHWAAVLRVEYASDDCLLKLGQENGWLNDTGTNGSRNIERIDFAELLVSKVFERGVDGLMAFANAVKQDYPASEEVLALYEQTRRLIVPNEILQKRGREQQVRECIQYLLKNTCLGVALMEPYGFDARNVVGRVIDRLSRIDERVLPVHLVPRRNTTSEERLYKALFRDLERGLAQALKQPLSGDWRDILKRGSAQPTTESFEDTLDELVRGPLEAEDRVLLFVVEGLGRVSEEHQQSWGYALARSSNFCSGAVQRLKILAMGGRALHALRTKPPTSGFSSAFHHLESIELLPLSKEDVEELAREQGIHSQNGLTALYNITAGHPALVQACFYKGKSAVQFVAKEDEFEQFLSSSVHMERLSNALDENPKAKERLCSMTRDRMAMRLDRSAEQTLKWLGIIVESDVPDQWTWTAPFMADWAGGVS